MKHITEPEICKGGQNPPENMGERPEPPKGSQEDLPCRTDGGRDGSGYMM